MEYYSSERHAVIDLHERGFTQDFQLFGNNLLWRQGKIFIRLGDFCLMEYHEFFQATGEHRMVIILGVLIIDTGVKGILMNSYYLDKYCTPQVLHKKIKGMNWQIATESTLYEMIFIN